MRELSPRPAYPGLPTHTGEPAGVIVAEERLALATVLARRGALQPLRERVRETHLLDLPEGPQVVSGGGVSFIGTAPGAWLAVGTAEQNLQAKLASELSGLAAVSDQSDGYAVLRLSGARIRDALAKGFTIDLHPSTFLPGTAAVTSVAHIGAILWRMPGQDALIPVFHVAVFRSFAESFWHWLSVSAAEYGIAAG